MPESGGGGVVADDRQVLDAGIKDLADDAGRRADAHEAAEQDGHAVPEKVGSFTPFHYLVCFHPQNPHSLQSSNSGSSKKHRRQSH